MSDTTIRVNGEDRTFAAGSSLEDLVAELVPGSREDSPGGRPRGVAAAVNGSVVTRGAWAQTALRDGDTVEIVTAVQGG